MIYLAVIYVFTLAMGGLLVRGLLGERGRAEAAWREERTDLLQRIQAPEHAVIARFNQDQPDDGVQAVNEFDDETYWLSREELAERVGEAEVTGG